MPEDGGDGMLDLGDATEAEMRQASGLQITGLRGTLGAGAGERSAAGHFTGLFSSSDDDESDSSDEEEEEEDEGDAGRDLTVGREEGDFEVEERRRRRRKGKGRRPSTTERKERGSIDDDDDDDDDDENDDDDDENMTDGINDGKVFGLPPRGNKGSLRGSGQGEEESSGSGEGSSSDDEGMVEIRTRRSS